MEEDADEDSEEELEVIDIDEVASGWGESYEEEEAEQQAEALLPVPLPRLIATPRPAMTSFAQIARGAAEAASPFSLPQQPPFSFTPATPPPTFALSPAAGTVAALSLADATVAPAAGAALTPVRAAVAAPLPPLMMMKKRAAAEMAAMATMTTVAAAAVSSEAQAATAMAASVVVAVAEEASDEDTDVGEGSEEEAAMEFASPKPSPLRKKPRKKPRGRPPNGTNGLPMRWHGPKEAGHWVVAEEQPSLLHTTELEEGMAKVFSASPPPPPPLPLPPPPQPPQPQPPPPPQQAQESEPSQLLLSLGPLKMVGRTLQRECYLVPAASAVGAAETAAVDVPAPRMKKLQITAAASAAALRVEAAEVEVMEVEMEVVDGAEGCFATAVVPAAQACEYCNSRGKVHRRCVRLPSCHVIWQRGGKRKHDSVGDALETAEVETAKATTALVEEAECLCAPTKSSSTSFKKSLLQRWVAEEPAVGAAALLTPVEPAEVGQTDAGEAALRQAEVEGLTLQRGGGKAGYRSVQLTRSSRFQAVVWRGSKKRQLGTFDTAEEAALAYARTPEAQAEIAGAGAATMRAGEGQRLSAARSSQCERHPRCMRGSSHLGKGGKCSLRPLPAAGDASLEQTAEGELEQDDDGGCFCGTDHLQSVGITFNGMSHWATFNDSWIQCDDCDRWCHSQCAGFGKESAEEAEAYSCPTCLCAARPRPAKRVLLAGNVMLEMEVETTAAAAAAALRMEALEVEAEAPAAIEATEMADVVSWRFTTLEMDTIPEEEEEDEDGVEDEDEDADEVENTVEAAPAEMQDIGAEGTPDVEMDVVEMMCTSPDQWSMLYAPLSGLFQSNSHLPLATAVVAIEPVPPYVHPDPGAAPSRKPIPRKQKRVTAYDDRGSSAEDSDE